MRLFIYEIGDLVTVPLLDPGNDAYLARVRFLGTLASEIVSRWEMYAAPGEEATSLADRLGYSIAKLAQMLCCEDMPRIREQAFFRRARTECLGENPDLAAKALGTLCRGFEEIQARIDRGIEPFGQEKVEPVVENLLAAGFLKEAAPSLPSPERLQLLLAR
ncbi:MAG: hypothetical protein ACLFN0_07260 [Thermovirgaceae bacterium]